MAIRYDLPAVGAQKGPTCWYTAVKMMLRFHNIGADQTRRAQWHELHELRKIITELAAAKKPYDYRSVLTAIISKMYATSGASADRKHLRSLKNKWEAAGSDARFSVLDAFLPGLIRPVILAAGQYDTTFVADSLGKYGPLYASVFRPGVSLMDMDYVQDPFPNQSGYVYKYDAKSSFGGRHAIVIFGVDDHDTIYYADPNAPHRYSMIPWEVLKGQLNSPGGSMGSALFGRVDCFDCHHIQTRRP